MSLISDNPRTLSFGQDAPSSTPRHQSWGGGLSGEYLDRCGDSRAVGLLEWSRGEKHSSWGEVFSWAHMLLGDKSSARWICEDVAGLPSAEFWAALDHPVTHEELDRVRSMVTRRLSGEPLQYILGYWCFRTLKLKVDRRVLIPRPESEQTAQAAIDWINSAPRSADELVVVDLGTGSGAIALSLAAEVQRKVEIWATDSSTDALDVAADNLLSCASELTQLPILSLGPWFEALPPRLEGRISVVVSNPPYISHAERIFLPREVVEWEPEEALIAGESGLEAIIAILSAASRWTTDDGVVILELAPSQGEEAKAMARENGFSDVRILPDLSGRERVLVARR